MSVAVAAAAAALLALDARLRVVFSTTGVAIAATSLTDAARVAAAVVGVVAAVVSVVTSSVVSVTFLRDARVRLVGAAVTSAGVTVVLLLLLLLLLFASTFCGVARVRVTAASVLTSDGVRARRARVGGASHVGVTVAVEVGVAADVAVGVAVAVDTDADAGLVRARVAKQREGCSGRWAVARVERTR